jgi:hypothetical protein
MCLSRSPWCCLQPFTCNSIPSSLPVDAREYFAGSRGTLAICSSLPRERRTATYIGDPRVQRPATSSSRFSGIRGRSLSILASARRSHPVTYALRSFHMWLLEEPRICAASICVVLHVESARLFNSTETCVHSDVKGIVLSPELHEQQRRALPPAWRSLTL